MNRIVVIVLGILIALMILSSTFYVVDQRRYAILFAFGEIKDVIHEPGLHFKLPPPFQNVVFLDKRTLTIDTPEAERFITSEKRNILVDTFVKWRIVDPKQYYISIGADMDRAVIRMGQIIKAALNEEITKRTTHEVVSGEREQVMAAIKQKVADEAKQIGVEIVDVRLKRVDLLPEISASIYSRMEAERHRVANELRSTGAAESEKIRADADRQKEIIIAEAYRDAERTKGEGDAKASTIYAQAFGANPEFYAFYRSLDAYRKSFRGKGDLFVVDPSTEFFKYLQSPDGTSAPAGHKR
ncbi:MAG: protease modulator HflC [Burkholderiaceae bacterium]